MANTIVCQPYPATSSQRADLEKLFASPAFLLLKEVIASHCITAQVKAMNAGLHPDSEAATAEKAGEELKAIHYNLALDLLDDLSKNDSKWFTVQLTHNNH